MLDTNIPQLPAQYVVRAPAERDIPAILTLLDDFEMAECGQPAGFNAEDIRGGWANLNVASDAWFVATLTAARPATARSPILATAGSSPIATSIPSMRDAASA